MELNTGQSAGLDVIVVGGGPAGLSAALYLGRSRRRTLVLDGGRPRNAASLAAHGVFTRDGASPWALLLDAHRELAEYPAVALRRIEAESVESLPSGFAVRLANGEEVRGRRLLLACGIRDELPPVEGVARLWGKGVLHCAYCHGYEVSDQPIALVAQGEASVAAIATLLQLSRNVVLCSNGPAGLGEIDRQRLAKKGVRIIEHRIEEIAGDPLDLSIRFADGSDLARAAVFVRTILRPGSELPAQLGCNFDMPYHLAVASNWETNIRGVYAAGDLAAPKDQIAVAAGSGVQAAIAINGDLVQEDFGGPWATPPCGALQSHG